MFSNQISQRQEEKEVNVSLGQPAQDTQIAVRSAQDPFRENADQKYLSFSLILLQV